MLEDVAKHYKTVFIVDEIKVKYTRQTTAHSIHTLTTICFFQIIAAISKIIRRFVSM